MNKRLTISVDLTQADALDSRVQALRSGLRDRRGLHAAIASEADRLTREYLIGLNRHKTAKSLGATPTGHHGKAARAVESSHDHDEAVVSIPASTGLGRAFGDVVIRPGSGRRYLTIPAHKRTYGKRAGEFSPGMFTFALVGGRHTALMFAESSDPDYWTVAYWLRTEVNQAQDRTLLPSDDGYKIAAFGATDGYVREMLTGGQAA